MDGDEEEEKDRAHLIVLAMGDVRCRFQQAMDRWV